MILAKQMLKIGKVYLTKIELKARRNPYKLWFAFLHNSGYRTLNTGCARAITAV